MQEQIKIYEDLGYGLKTHVWNSFKHAYGKVFSMKNAAACLIDLLYNVGLVTWFRCKEID